METQTVIGPRPITGATGTAQLMTGTNVLVQSVPAPAQDGTGLVACDFTDVAAGWYRWQYKDSLGDVRNRGLWVYVGAATGTYYVDDVPATDSLFTDPEPELSAAPAATSSLKDKITWIFMLARNRVLQTSSLQTLKADDGTTNVATAAVSDDGTTYDRGEFS